MTVSYSGIELFMTFPPSPNVDLQPRQKAYFLAWTEFIVTAAGEKRGMNGNEKS